MKKKLSYDQPFHISFTVEGLGSTQMDGELFITTANIFKDNVEEFIIGQVAKGIIKSYTISVSVDELKEAKETMERSK